MHRDARRSFTEPPRSARTRRVVNVGGALHTVRHTPTEASQGVLTKAIPVHFLVSAPSLRLDSPDGVRVPPFLPRAPAKHAASTADATTLGANPGYRRPQVGRHASHRRAIHVRRPRYPRPRAGRCALIKHCCNVSDVGRCRCEDARLLPRDRAHVRPSLRWRITVLADISSASVVAAMPVSVRAIGPR